jgi:cell division septum initiation protein DivIVA
MEKILPAGADDSKLSKKIASKYAELKQEHQRLLQEIDSLKQAAAGAAGGEQQPH